MLAVGSVRRHRRGVIRLSRVSVRTCRPCGYMHVAGRSARPWLPVEMRTAAAAPILGTDLGRASRFRADPRRHGRAVFLFHSFFHGGLPVHFRDRSRLRFSIPSCALLSSYDRTRKPVFAKHADRLTIELMSCGALVAGVPTPHAIKIAIAHGNTGEVYICARGRGKCSSER